MAATPLASALDLCRENGGVAERWIATRGLGGSLRALAVLTVCAAAYGASIGAWRDPLLAVFVAIKLPMLLVGTALVDGLLHALVARRLGFELTPAASQRAVLAGFALASVVLAAFAPVVLLFDLSLPAPGSPERNVAHATLGLLHVAAVGFAGCVAVLRQRRWLETWCVEPRAAARVVGVWLLLDLLVGAQLSWVLRPWFGTPGLAVQFLREHPLRGNFYESLYLMVVHVTR